MWESARPDRPGADPYRSPQIETLPNSREGFSLRWLFRSLGFAAGGALIGLMLAPPVAMAPQRHYDIPYCLGGAFTAWLLYLVVAKLVKNLGSG